MNEENIYSSIYSLESYIFEKGLLSRSDLVLYNNLLDKYNTNLIKETIELCQEKLKEILTTDRLFEIKVYLKPKKTDKNNSIVYRPIHTADLYTQICIVSLLNQIMFDDTSGKRKLSDLSKLLPSNFYGNIPCTNIETIFEPWSKKYQEYSEKAIEANKKYCKTKKYLKEINLDLENFYPSIDPHYIFSFILEKTSISYPETEKDCLESLLFKLLFFNIKEIENNIHQYYLQENIDEIKENELYYNIGIPQGLPQAYFFGNLCMIQIAKEIETVFPGDAYYYVDDSIIFSNFQEDFEQGLRKLNQGIEEHIFSIKKNRPIPTTYLSPKLETFISLIKYNIKLHDGRNGKSSISNISPAEYLYQFAKPASTTSSEIRSSLDDLEDASLQEKIEAILSLIEFRLKEANNKGDESIIKQLQRYKKFYSYRLKTLEFREENEISLEELDNYFERFGLNDNSDLNLFIDKLKDDIYLFESQLILKYLNGDTTKQKSLLDRIKRYEKKLSENITHNYFSYTLNSFLISQQLSNRTYESLEKLISNTFEPFIKVRQEKRINVIKSLIKLLNNSPCQEISNTAESIESRLNAILQLYQSSCYSFVYNNSASFIRRIINSVLSNTLCISINDSCNLTKDDNRPLCYYELRILMFARTNSFDLAIFTTFANNIINDIEANHSYEKIDFALFEVLPIFKRYVKNPIKIDELILIHRYINGIWKNGSKFLHFYTLHNEEHSIELINNSVRIIKNIDYLSIKEEDFYILFLACYLHDISMVLYPDLDTFSEDNTLTDLIYSEWKVDFHKFQDIESAKKSEIKKYILKYYEEVNNYFENMIRDNHQKRSAKFIKQQNDLSIIDKFIRQIVADISEAHGYEAKDIYKLKSKAKDDVFNEKYLKIILRLADLLDMSKDRVSINVLRQNIKHMSKTSKYHWISHMAIDKCYIKTHFTKIEENIKTLDKKYKIPEIVQINIDLNTKQFTTTDKNGCKNLICETTNNEKESFLTIKLEKEKKCGENCNFMCNWMVNKQKYLFEELQELQQYLDRNPHNVFDTEFQVKLNFENTTVLPLDYIDIIRKGLEPA